ncbi:MAG: hypothetical protein HZA91_18990, partial [Verrucomicrobia bacterium]|nr:hypothetical protein [Verrucomicrobiota bacterium]
MRKRRTGTLERSARRRGGPVLSDWRPATVMASVALFVCALLNCEAVAAQDGWPFRIEIEKGVPSIRSFPRSLSAKVGWRYPCPLEVTNKDAAPRTLALRADGRDVLTALHDPITLSPGQRATSTFLLQTLNPFEHALTLTASCGTASATARINVAPSLDWGGVSFGTLDHFNIEGPIAELAQPPGQPAKQAGKGWKGSPEHMARLATAPGPEMGARILTDMRLLQDLGCQVYRTDVSWSIVEAA